MNPLLALLVSIALILFFLLLFIPKSGWISKWRKIKKSSKKELLEDILKYLYNTEYNNGVIITQNLARDLNISDEAAKSYLEQLQQMKLIEKERENIVLTSEGKSYALRIIRVHRLWEKYLADHTGVKETEWHHLAEIKEHKLDREETNRLAAILGNPLHDPHGDPIPDETGEMPGSRGIALTKLQEREFGRIIHIEDEPKELYAQIIAMGFYPGMQIRILEKTPDIISIEAEGDECRLAIPLALNITVVPLVDTEIIQESFITLSSIKEGESVEVLSLSNALRGQQRRRLLDLGIVPGTKITVQLKSLSGDPTAYDVRGATIALRKNQSDYIFIKRDENSV